MAMTLDRSSELVSLERGEVNRRIFSDPEIFEMEMELIFGRAWLFLAHESMLKKAGDFFEAPMGRDNVLVVRQKDASLRAFINSCTHRGNAVCRADEGNTKNFMCTYHGWTFDLAGKLIGVPGLENLYHNDLDKDALGLRQVAQIDSYNGFIFATMDPTAPPLHEYLGTTGRLGLDFIALRGENMEVIPGIQKFVIDTNWKFPVDNTVDWYHAPVTHVSAFNAGLMGGPGRRPMRQVTEEARGGAATPDGADLPVAPSPGWYDSIVVLGEYGHIIGGPSVNDAPNTGEWRQRPGVAERLGTVGMRVAGHPNLFPNAWVTSGAQLSLRVPREPNRTEIWFFSFIDRAAPPEAQKWQQFSANHIFGPAGFLEQDDGENWAMSTKQTTGMFSRHIPQALKMGLGRGKIIHEDGLARVEGNTNESAQLWNYNSWAQWMKGLSWDELKTATTPGDRI